MNCHDADVDEARYLQVIRYKTAKLFEAAAQLGAILGKATATRSRPVGCLWHASWYGFPDHRRRRSDYSGAEAEMGKHLGDDLAEGKPTLPLILVIQHGVHLRTQRW